ncbi:hypothetical protein D3C81_1715220 [compost metagenome]
MQHTVEIAGNVFGQVMAENQLAVGVVHAGAVGGDHKGADLEVIADLRNVDMMTAGSKDKMYATLGQQLQCLFGVRGQSVVG